MFGVAINAHAEEVQELSANGDQSTIKWYIGKEAADLIAACMACPSCLEPFPAPPDPKNLKIWRDHAHHYAGLRTPDELIKIVKEKRCPICKYEVSPEMFAATHRGKDPFEPEKIEVPE